MKKGAICLFSPTNTRVLLFFEVIHSSVQGVAIWAYLFRLIKLLEGSTTDKAYRALVLQEISNIC